MAFLQADTPIKRETHPLFRGIRYVLYQFSYMFIFLTFSLSRSSRWLARVRDGDYCPVTLSSPLPLSLVSIAPIQASSPHFCPSSHRVPGLICLRS